MTDIRIVSKASLSGMSMDWLLKANGQLDESEQLASAVVMALGTDRRALPDDVLPDLDDDNRRGWWGDTHAEVIWQGWPVGCRLWLLSRAKITGQAAKGGGTLFLIESYIKETLQPFIEAGVCSRFTVDVQRDGVERVVATVVLYRGPLPAIQLRFQSLWDEIRSA